MALSRASAEDRLGDLRAQAAWSRQRRDLYKAKSYGPRATSPARMRELERQAAQADQRLKSAIADQQR